MPLEPGGPDKYISDLNKDWPLGTDSRTTSDDHHRLVKEILQNSFPGWNGPVTRSRENINQGSVPQGSVTIFYQATPPAGWQRITGISTGLSLRLVSDAESGGGGGGVDDPFEMGGSQVPQHFHGNSQDTGPPIGSGDIVWCSNGATQNIIRLAAGSNYTAYSNSQHIHKYGANTGFNSGPGTWRPRYFNVILCSRTIGPV